MKQKTGKKLLTIMLMLVMVIGLVPEMSLAIQAQTTSTGTNIFNEFSEQQTVYTTDHIKLEGSGTHNETIIVSSFMSWGHRTLE